MGKKGISAPKPPVPKKQLKLAPYVKYPWEPPDWRQEDYRFDDECWEEKEPPQYPLIVSPEEAENKYTDPKLMAKVIYYCKVYAEYHMNEIDEIQKLLLDIEKKILDLDWKVKLLSPPPKREHVPEDKALLLNKISREDWEAVEIEPYPVQEITHPVTKIHVTYGTNTETSNVLVECQEIMRRIQRRDLDSGLPDIAYNFIIADDGSVYEGRGWFYKPELASKAPEYADQTVDIAFLGTYPSDHDPDSYRDLLDDLIQFGLERDWVSKDYKILPYTVP